MLSKASVGRRYGLAGLVVLCVSVAGGGVAWAGVAHEKVGEIFSGGKIPMGVAINQSTQDFYVANTVQGTVVELNSTGTDELQVITGGKGGQPFGTFDVTDIAVDNATDGSAGDLYVPDEVHNVVDKFTSDGTFVCQLDEGEAACPGAKSPVPFNHPEAVAVDSHGDVYVSDTGNDVIDVFSPTGQYINQIAASNSLPLQAPRGIAVNSHGDVYVATMGTKAAYGVVEFKPSSEEVLATTTWSESEFEVGPAEQDATAVATDAANDVYVANYNTPAGPDVVEHSETGNALATFGQEVILVYGLAISDTTHDVYLANYEGIETNEGRKGTLVAYNTFEGEEPEAPITGTATAVTGTTAILHGIVNPVGSTEAGYHFAYNTGLTCQGDGTTTPGGLAPRHNESVETEITGLSPKTKYTFCLVATDPFGSVPGLEVSFETLAAKPSIQSQFAPEKTRTTATVSAVIDPEGADTTCKVQYGLTASYGSEAPCPAGLGEGTAGVPVSVKLTGLQPEKTYHYQFIATNTVGTSEGREIEDATFEAGEAPEQPATEPASSVSPNTTVFNGKLNPDGLTGELTYYFEYNSGVSCSGEGAKTTAQSTIAEAKETTVNTEVTELAPETRYTFCLVATNRSGTTAGLGESVRTPASQPVVEGESSLSVGSTEATVSAEVNAGDLPTTYHVDYGTSTEYGSSTPEVGIGQPLGSVAVRARLSGLQPGTLYHFRFLAKNAFLGAEGADVTFTTVRAVASEQATLPDNRAYELVSPPENSEVYYPGHGLGTKADIFGTPGFRAAAGGNAVAYLGDPPATGVGGSGLSGQGAGNQYLATRGANGWVVHDILPDINASEFGLEWSAFSNDLAVETFETDYPIEAESQAPAECIEQRQLVLYANTASGRQMVPKPTGVCGGETVGISANDAHILYFDNGVIYDAINGYPYSVAVLPDGEPEPNPDAMVGGSPLGHPFREGGDFLSNAISSDASHIFWTSLKTEVTPDDPAGTRRLFVRENDTQPQSPLGPKGECTVSGDACTVQLDVAQQGAQGSSGGGLFWTASGDGSKVFFTDCSRLTSDSTAVSGGGCGIGGSNSSYAGNDLYEYDFGKPLGERLSDITVDHNATDALGANVQGVIGATEDGSYVYFVATGVLTQGANAEGNKPVAGEPNMYVSHGGATTFVVTLSPADNHNPGPNPDQGPINGSGDWLGDLGLSTAEVAPDGHDIAFMSGLPLTGDGSGGVFVYDADAQRIFCASCSPSGGQAGGSVTFSSNDTFRTRFINAEGSEVFFDTEAPLVPQDTNGLVDVYEWERDGTGSCRQSPGCVSLLSTASASSNAYFVDASASGNDAFFTSRALLVPQARDEDAKLYDARVGGGFHEASLACTGTGCQGVPAPPPVFATPSSATFEGVGNFEPESKPAVKPRSKPVKCKRGFVKAHGRCVRKPAKKPGKRSKRRRK